MDKISKTLIEILNLLLQNLDLEQNIFGYIAVLLILCSLVLLKIFILAYLAKHLKKCNEAKFEDFNLDFFGLVDKPHRKFRLLEKLSPFLANNCGKIRQNSASKQAEESTISANPNNLCQHTS